MNSSFKNDPIDVITVDEDLSIHLHTDVLRNIISLANGRYIKFIIVIGSFQKGKTSFISLLTGNNRHKIGNGSIEMNTGVNIDGPYTNREIAVRWGLNNYENDEDTSIFIFDIEGFNGYRRGSDQNSQCFFTKLCAPFASISSCIVLISDENEVQSTSAQCLSVLKFSQINNADNQFNLMTLVRNIDIYDGCNYKNPNMINYIEVSQKLETNIQSRMFNEQIDCQLCMRPLPFYEKHCDPFHQKNSYNDGFRLVVNDIMNILSNSNSQISLNNPRLITNIVVDTFNFFNDFSTNFEDESQNALLNKILRIVQSYFNQIDSIDRIITNINDSTRQLSLNDHIELDEVEIFQKVSEIYMIGFAQAQNNLNPAFLQLDDVHVYIQNICLNAITDINLRIQSIIRFNIQLIIEKFQNLYHQSINVNNIATDFENQQRSIDLSNSNSLIPINENDIMTSLITNYRSKYNEMINNYVNRSYRQRDEIIRATHELETNTFGEFQRKIPDLIRFDIQLITEKFQNLQHNSINIDNIIVNYQNHQREITISNSNSNNSNLIHTNERSVYNDLFGIYRLRKNALNDSINSQYLEIDEIDEQIEEYELNITTNFRRQMPEIIRFNINLITEQYRNLQQSINIYQIIQDYNESKDLIELNNSQSLIEIDETIIFEILKNKYLSKMNAFCNNLNSSYTRLPEIVRLKERFRIDSDNQIRNNLPSIKRSNIDKIKRKLGIIANGIKEIIKKKIKQLIQLMSDQKVLDKIISKENELVSLFKNFLVEIVNNRFSMKMNKAYESIQEISEFKEVIFLNIERDLHNEMPQLTKKNEK